MSYPHDESYRAAGFQNVLDPRASASPHAYFPQHSHQQQYAAQPAYAPPQFNFPPVGTSVPYDQAFGAPPTHQQPPPHQGFASHQQPFYPNQPNYSPHGGPFPQENINIDPSLQGYPRASHTPTSQHQPHFDQGSYLPPPQHHPQPSPFGSEPVQSPGFDFGLPPAPAPAPKPQATPSSLKITLPAMPTTRRQARGQSDASIVENGADAKGSGSEYAESDADGVVPEPEHEPVESPEPIRISRGGRRLKQKNYQESSDVDFYEDEEEEVVPRRRNGRTPAAPVNGRAKGKGRNLRGFVDEEEKEDDDNDGYGLRRSTRTRAAVKRISDEDDVKRPSRSRAPPAPAPAPLPRGSRHSRRLHPDAAPDEKADTPPDALDDGDETSSPAKPTRLTRGRKKSPKRSAAEKHDEDGYVDADPTSSPTALSASPPLSDELDADGEPDVDVDGDGDFEPADDEQPREYGLRKRARVNYAVPPPLEDLPAPPPRRRPKPKPARGLGWSATGAQLSRWMGEDSDSDRDAGAPVGGLGAGGGGAAFAGGGGALLPGDLGAAGGPSNLGKLPDAALADADPLGVNHNVTFEEVGGLDAHITALKEMTVLPLLYPEVFQRFDVTPPRGVLFHGPPGTGKTLLARALAASCRSNGRSISFFMRKGADCLSKWVGEAERQLRLLFDEARACQPSIIFFDEIDGLAPVRSSKQDQVHASIVSTLLALMDGMDGRGQVVVIGATNRPDAIDPALRRPGRFDREFYFPLPDARARERIVRIMTRKWDGWEGEKGEANAARLAELTKGYGGADLRALCTEAALNAVQRRYPQIYESNERLLLQPETIGVEVRDFMLAVKKLVPSSARSTSATAAPLPPQLGPLLDPVLEQVKEAINRVLPLGKKRSALEEAQFEEETEGGSLERELALQSLETLRVHRPRLVLHGPPGAGQGYVAAAALHHLEGTHVQSLELGALLSDSTRTLDAALVQLFMEAKRNQPAVVYIPALAGWCAAVPESARATVRALLDALAPTDPVLLLAVVDGAFADLPRDVRAWFGPARENRVLLGAPSDAARGEFFAPVLTDAARAPDAFPDGVPRRRRVLEVLPIAPPIAPREPTAAELQAQEEGDRRTIALLKYRLSPVITELKRKFKRFTKPAEDEYAIEMEEEDEVEVVPETPSVAPPSVPVTVIEEAAAEAIAEAVTVEIDMDPDAPTAEPVNGIASGSSQMQAQLVPPSLPPLPPPVSGPAAPPKPKLHNMDLEKLHSELYRDKYLTPGDFLADVRKIAENAHACRRGDAERALKAHALLTAAEVALMDLEPQLRQECERMAVRERRRREERRAERNKAKAAAAAQADSRGTPVDGVRRSTRGLGAPLAVDLNGNPDAALRRARSLRGSGAASPASAMAEDTPAPDARKRAHADDEGELPAAPAKRARSEMHEDSPAPVVPIPPRGMGHLLNPVAGAVLGGAHPFALAPDGDASVPAIAIAPEPEPTPPMAVDSLPAPRPELVVPEAALSALRDGLWRTTGALGVERLEQLRAMLVGAVWRHRTEWDRGALVGEMGETVARFVKECEEDDAE